jgi:NAD(P)-dependent dehydrogenase (short-subunit alcohol dehydrogenase family)
MQYAQGEIPGIHVVDVHPGQVRETDMAAKATGGPYESVSHVDDGTFKHPYTTREEADLMIADLAGDFIVWAASKEARFLKGKLVWVNWDVEELKAGAKETASTRALTLGLDGFYPGKY